MSLISLPNELLLPIFNGLARDKTLSSLHSFSLTNRRLAQIYKDNEYNLLSLFFICEVKEIFPVDPSYDPVEFKSLIELSNAKIYTRELGLPPKETWTLEELKAKHRNVQRWARLLKKYTPPREGNRYSHERETYPYYTYERTVYLYATDSFPLLELHIKYGPYWGEGEALVKNLLIGWFENAEAEFQSCMKYFFKTYAPYEFPAQYGKFQDASNGWKKFSQNIDSTRGAWKTMGKICGVWSRDGRNLARIWLAGVVHIEENEGDYYGCDFFGPGPSSEFAALGGDAVMRTFERIADAVIEWITTKDEESRVSTKRYFEGQNLMKETASVEEDLGIIEQEAYLEEHAQANML